MKTTITITIEREGDDLQPVQDLALLICETLFLDYEMPALSAHKTRNGRSITITAKERTKP